MYAYSATRPSWSVTFTRSPSGLYAYWIVLPSGSVICLIRPWASRVKAIDGPSEENTPSRVTETVLPFRSVAETSPL